jgi:two-component system, OmpR family, sensor kinase
MDEGTRLKAPLASPDVQLATLECLLAIRATDRRPSLREVAHILAGTFAADKVDVFLYDPSAETLIAEGTSDTALGREQHRLGLDRLALANGGSAVRVFKTGEAHLTRRADQEEGELVGIVEGLGIRAEIIAPVEIAGMCRGVVLASSHIPEYFSDDHLRLLVSVARWVGLVAERAELAERLAAEAAASARQTTAEELMAVLAHDLRNHLSALRGRLDLLRRQAQRAGHGEYVRGADAAILAADRLGKLVADLLDSERLARGLFSLRPEAVNLSALVREAAGSFDTEAVDIAVQGPDELWVSADPNRLRQCLENLLANAIHHSPTAGHVTIDLASDSRHGIDGARITIEDQGPGIPAELAPRLFERFARGPSSPGMGLGLFLASRIASAHAGTLTLDSPPGMSARFTLWLPIVPSIAGDEARC